MRTVRLNIQYALYEIMGGIMIMAANEKEMRIKIIKDGPYRVTGGVPLLEQVIVTDDDGHTRDLIDIKEYPGGKPISYAAAAHPKTSPSVMGHTVRSVLTVAKQPAERLTWKRRKLLKVLI